MSVINPVYPSDLAGTTGNIFFVLQGSNDNLIRKMKW